MTASLAERLKTETRALHTSAERSTFMAVLLRGRMERPAYCALLRNLHGIYAVLEPALEQHAQHPVIAPVHLPALWRGPALEHDLDVLHGAGWLVDLPLLSAALDYTQRLRELGAARPALLLAHAYVRYLGDLSGGQMMGGIVARTLPAQDARAVAFYDFGDAQRTYELTLAFRAGLGSVVADAALTDELVHEARQAFEWHRRLFDELANAYGLVEPAV